MSTLPELQKSLLESEDLLLRVEATLLFPHIGGYSTLPFDSTMQILEPPRPTEIKALWRWWARVILSAAYGGSKNYEALDREVGELLGKTYGEALSSLFTLRVNCSNLNEINEIFVKFYKDHLQRYERIDSKLKELFTDLIKKPFKINIEFRSFGAIDVVFKESLPKDVREKLKRSNLRVRKKRGHYILTISHNNFNNIVRIPNIDNVKYNNLIIDLNEYFKYRRISRIFIISQIKEEEEQKDFRKRLAIEAAILDTFKNFNLKITIDLFIVSPQSDVLNKLKNGLKFALLSYVVSLLFGAIGYASRRGFGSIIIEEVQEGPALRTFISDLSDIKESISKLKSEESPEEIERILKELLQKTYNKAKEYAKVRDEGRVTIGIPQVPTALLDDCFKIKVFKCKSPLHALRCISKATLKEEWKDLVGARRRPGGEFHTWILGLPRSVKGCGYFMGKYRENRGRRPSAFHFKLLKNSKGTFIVVYGFLSRDWPVDSLYHFSCGHGHFPVKNSKIATPSSRKLSPSNNTEIFLRQVFRSAFDFIIEIIKKCCSNGE